MLSYSADETYTLEDLLHWNFQGTSLAVLGKPVRHSISPQMHNAALAALRETNPELKDWRYFRFEIDPEKLLESLPLFHEKGFAGLNLTVPHKEIAFAALEKMDPSTQAIRAVNTLLRNDAFYSGYNTDGFGLARGIEIGLKRQMTDSDIILLGAGGAARAAAVQAIESSCSSLVIVNRNQDRLARLVAEMQPLAKAKDIPLRSCAADALSKLPENCLLINATSLGLKDDDPTPIPESKIDRPIDCFDMIYNPTETRTMRIVSEKGGRTCNGLPMLIHQGARSLEIWTGEHAPDDVMQAAAENALASLSSK